MRELKINSFISFSLPCPGSHFDGHFRVGGFQSADVIQKFLISVRESRRKAPRIDGDEALPEIVLALKVHVAGRGPGTESAPKVGIRENA